MHMGKSLTYQPRNLQPQWKLGQEKMFPGFSSPSPFASESAGFLVCLRTTPGQADAVAAGGLNSGAVPWPGSPSRSRSALAASGTCAIPAAPARAGGNLRHGRGSTRAERRGRRSWGCDLLPRGAPGAFILPWHAGAGRGREAPLLAAVSRWESS